MTEVHPHENPLVPNDRLREIYIAMAAMRALEERLKRRKAGKKLHATRGEEACRVSATIDLQPGDLISDSRPGVAMDLPSGKNAGSQSAAHVSSNKMPWIKGEDARLRLAMGAALAFKLRKQPNLVLAYAQGKLKKAAWRPILGIASRLELPIVFVLLPSPAPLNKKRPVSPLGTSLSGVPIIAVDASDAVALYRVAQESFGRIRTGGGPVLIDAVAFVAHGDRGAIGADPLSQMRHLLLTKKIVTKTWLDKAERHPQRRIGTAEVPNQIRG